MKYLFLAALILSPGAFAENTKNPCRADIQKFCKDVTKEKGGKVQCLKKHLTEISPECKKKLDSLKEKKDSEHFESASTNEKSDSKVSEQCKGVKFKDPMFKECMQEKFNNMKSQWAKRRKEKEAKDSKVAEVKKVEPVKEKSPPQKKDGDL